MCRKKIQGSNINANPNVSFAEKIFHWLNVGMWSLVMYLNKADPDATVDW